MNNLQLVRLTVRFEKIRIVIVTFSRRCFAQNISISLLKNTRLREESAGKYTKFNPEIDSK